MVILIVLGLIITAASIVSIVYLRPSQPSFSLNAIIVDQLGVELPNPDFAANASNILQTHGFTVAYYSDHNQTIDVDFFKGLAKGNYGIVILREHMALRDDNSTVDLFTSELYNPTKHGSEMDNELVIPGIINYTGTPKEYFAVTAKFIENLEGTFPRSIVIAMGCWGLKPGLEGTLAGAFVSKGAEVFLGWTELVAYTHTDDETVKLLENLLTYNKTVDEAVDLASWDLTYGSQMKYYPLDAGGVRISSLMAEVRANSALELQLATLTSTLRIRGKHNE